MKGLVLVLLFIAQTVFGLEIIGADYYTEQDLIEVKVRYIGGCFEHQFQMDFGECRLHKTDKIGYMRICDAHIVDATPQKDTCGSLVEAVLKFSLKGLRPDARPDLLGFNESNVVLVPKKS